MAKQLPARSQRTFEFFAGSPPGGISPDHSPETMSTIRLSKSLRIG